MAFIDSKIYTEVERNQDNCCEYIAMVCERARDIFRACGREEDFCIQHWGMMGIVFGGWNRVIWTAKTGSWRLSESHCSDSFIEAFNALMSKERE